MNEITVELNGGYVWPADVMELLLSMDPLESRGSEADHVSDAGTARDIVHQWPDRR